MPPGSSSVGVLLTFLSAAYQLAAAQNASNHCTNTSWFDVVFVNSSTFVAALSEGLSREDVTLLDPDSGTCNFTAVTGTLDFRFAYDAYCQLEASVANGTARVWGFRVVTAAAHMAGPLMMLAAFLNQEQGLPGRDFTLDPVSGDYIVPDRYSVKVLNRFDERSNTATAALEPYIGIHNGQGPPQGGYPDAARVNYVCSFATDPLSLEFYMGIEGDWGTLLARSTGEDLFTTAPYAGEGAGVTDEGDEAQFTSAGVAQGGVDRDTGAVYMADEKSHVIRSIYLNLWDEVVVETVAGSGKQGFLDSGDAMEAEFESPARAALHPRDAAVLYVSDRGNHCVRRIEVGAPVTSEVPVGGVSTAVGQCGVSGYRDGGLAGALLTLPWGVAVRAGKELGVGDTLFVT
ncbi:hypothetical protein CYMTET_53343 [Cymbomonas tetramitiformis]|uniref:Uncharacterized protein n=1 Tax=Cymbomonas tetramitiformis TaxID=36881 RepID=A0AAE0BH87_9CHLO|nr:hypothetical protein CYMTET_53343 [Cymbomonas tetramitiformis]